MAEVTKDDIGLYAFGELAGEDKIAFEALVYEDAELQQELEEFWETLAMLDGVGVNPEDPQPTAKKQDFLAAIAALEEEERGSEKPPIITNASVAADYEPWTVLPQHQVADSYDNLFYIPFAQNEDGVSIIVWLDKGLPEETHHDSIEKFLILQGSCTISFRGEEHQLKAGDVMSIPLHTPHNVTVTSEVACKMIVQRIAA